MADNVKASFDLTTNEGKIRAFNAQNGASVSLKNLEDGEVIECTGIMQYEEIVDSYGKPQEATVTVLFAADGQSYAGVSDTVAQAGTKLIDLFEATGLDVINIALVKQTSGKGNEFLNIRAAL